MGRICCRIMQDAPLDCMIAKGLLLNHKFLIWHFATQTGLFAFFLHFPSTFRRPQIQPRRAAKAFGLLWEGRKWALWMPDSWLPIIRNRHRQRFALIFLLLNAWKSDTYNPFSSHSQLRRKALQPFLQTFATAPANVCIPEVNRSSGPENAFSKSCGWVPMSTLTSHAALLYGFVMGP